MDNISDNFLYSSVVIPGKILSKKEGSKRRCNIPRRVASVAHITSTLFDCTVFNMVSFDMDLFGPFWLSLIIYLCMFFVEFKMFYRPRFLHWLWANIWSYFWLPCPICGNNFGGHEYSGSLDYSDFTGEGVCPQCAEEAKKRNKIRREKQDSEGFWVMNERDGSMRFKNREEYIKG